MIAAPLAPRAATAAAQRLGGLALTSVSNPRPELVSGGEALIRVRVPARVQPSAVRVTANRVNVTSSFAAQPDGSLLGLVTGLNPGRNRLVAVGGGQAAELTVTD